MTYNPDNEFDLSDVVGSDNYNLNEANKIFKGHNFRMIGGLAIVFIIGGFQALHGIAGWSAWIDMILPVLLVAEHALNGNS